MKKIKKGATRISLPSIPMRQVEEAKHATKVIRLLLQIAKK